MPKSNRHSIRLHNYDYSQSGWYFVTICTQNRECIFGQIVGAIHESPQQMKLNDYGMIVENVWQSLPKRFPIVLDEFQIMPNHIHMIIHIVGAHHDAPNLHHDVRAIHNDDVRAIHESPLRKRSLLSIIIGYFKMNSSKMIHNSVGAHHDAPIYIWQRNYYERIIRDEEEYQHIRHYIKTNPQNWDEDKNNPLFPPQQ